MVGTFWCNGYERARGLLFATEHCTSYLSQKLHSGEIIVCKHGVTLRNPGPSESIPSMTMLHQMIRNILCILQDGRTTNVKRPLQTLHLTQHIIPRTQYVSRQQRYLPYTACVPQPLSRPWFLSFHATLSPHLSTMSDKILSVSPIPSSSLRRP